MDFNTYQLNFNGQLLKINDQNNGSYMFSKFIQIFEFSPLYRKFFGKIVTVKILCNKKEKALKTISLLNSFKDLKDTANNIISPKKIKKLKIGNKVIEEGEIMSLYSLGIKSDFTCFVEYEE